MTTELTLMFFFLQEIPRPLSAWINYISMHSGCVGHICTQTFSFVINAPNLRGGGELRQQS